MSGNKLLCCLIAILHHVIQQGSLNQTLKNMQSFSANLSSWEFRQKNLVLMKVKHLLFLGKLLGLRPRSEWVNRTRVPWPLGGHMKDCFIDSVKFKRLMKVRCTCTTATLL